MDLKAYIRDIPDFPRPGILFRDITPLLADAGAFQAAIERLADACRDKGVQRVVAIEARGFIVGGALAAALGAGVVPVRKKGKLPFRTKAVSYELEYGTDTVEMHEDGVRPGERVLLVDDLLATGGTARAGLDLIGQAGGQVVACAFLIELTDLGGRAKLSPPHEVVSLIQY